MTAEDNQNSAKTSVVGTSIEQIAEEERLRADCYALLARLLMAPPDAELLQQLAAVGASGSPLGDALGALAEAARKTTSEQADEEYLNLFIGVGSGELKPFASYYLTGFLNEKPLAKLRQDMAELGIARAEDVKEPEDHVAALCEMMAGLITGAFGDAADLETQREFFDRQLAGWASRFFQDLEAAKTSDFYVPVGQIGKLFVEIESAAFGMISDGGTRRPH